MNASLSMGNLVKNIEELKRAEQYELDMYGKSSAYIPSQFRRLDKQSYEQVYRTGQRQLNELKMLPFWLNNVTEEVHEEIKRRVIKETGKPLCCFCHAVGLPHKKLKPLPIFDYEIEMIEAYRDYSKIFMRKPRGFGATTINNYYLAWFSLVYGYKFNGYRIMYVSGIGYAAAVDMIFRLKEIFMTNYPELIMSWYSTNDTQVINGIIFQAYAGENIKALRHYHNVIFLVCDEADYFEESTVKEFLGVVSTYEEKSGAKIILISTPNMPDGLFYNIEFETSDDYKGWKKILKDWTHGVGKIFDQSFIDREKDKTYFRREYMGKYEGNVGGMFPYGWVEAATEISKMFPNYKINPIMPNMVHYIGVDPAWGASERASKFSITVTRYNPTARYPVSKAPDDYYKRIKVDEKSDYNLSFNADLAEIVHFQQKRTPNVREALKDCIDLYAKYGRKNVYFCVDGSAIPFIQALKGELHESENYLSLDPVHWKPSQGFKVVPILPNKDNNEYMYKNIYHILSARLGSIPEEFKPISIGIGGANGKDFSLDKKKSPENDALDSTGYSWYFIREQNQNRSIFYTNP